MPIVRYAPKGAAPLVYEFDWGDFLVPEAIAIQKVCGKDWDDIPAAFLAGDIAVTYGVFQALAKRDGLNGAALKPTTGELSRDLTRDEYRVMLVAMREELGPDRGAWTDEQTQAERELSEYVGESDAVEDVDADEEIVLDDGSDASLD